MRVLGAAGIFAAPGGGCARHRRWRPRARGVRIRAEPGNECVGDPLPQLAAVRWYVHAPRAARRDRSCSRGAPDRVVAPAEAFCPSIVSSVVLDSRCELFAVAGVAKSIKLFDYTEFLEGGPTSRFPMRSMQSDAKISCLCFSPTQQELLGTACSADARARARACTQAADACRRNNSELGLPGPRGGVGCRDGCQAAAARRAPEAHLERRF